MKLNSYFYPDLVRDEIILKYGKYIVDTEGGNTFLDATEQQKKEALERMKERKELLDKFFNQYGIE